MNSLETLTSINSISLSFVRADIEIETGKIPLLENGDHLRRAEFERRFDAEPELKKAELINGIVYMSSPVRIKKHARPHAHVMGWLFLYHAATPGTDIGDNGSVRVDEDIMPQPDGFLRIDEAYAGQSYIDQDDYLQNLPELVFEVASSSASYDLHEKLEMYLLHGVKEYVVWRVLENSIDWFRLEGNTYQQVQPDENGVITSTNFPGLRLAADAFINGNLAAVLAELQKGIDSEEHKNFVAKLATQRQATLENPSS
jgi:Uma2 family endonuclease